MPLRGVMSDIARCARSDILFASKTGEANITGATNIICAANTTRRKANTTEKTASRRFFLGTR